MVQDIAPHKFHNEYRPDARPAADSPVIRFDGRNILLKKNEEGNGVYYPEARYFDVCNLVYAFAVDETEFFLDLGYDIGRFKESFAPKEETDRCLEILEEQGFRFMDLWELRSFADNVCGMIAFTGNHLNDWYASVKYCGRCGTLGEHIDFERAKICPACGRRSYPQIMPAVIVGVLDGDRILVTKYKAGIKFYALIAGFTEIGETLEETVAREVMEETGLKVKNIRYYKSQPWGIARDLLAGFYCDVDGSTEIRIDENELSVGEWKTREEIELQPDSYSLTNEMMLVFKEGKI